MGVAAESPRAADKRGGRDSGGDEPMHCAQGLCAVLLSVLSVLSVRVRVSAVCILCVFVSGCSACGRRIWRRPRRRRTGTRRRRRAARR